MPPAQYVVIFKAITQALDEKHLKTAQYLREKALSEYHCQKFESVTDAHFEIALSYWQSLDDIDAWHLDAEHQVAQQHGKLHWYQHFSVEICEIQKSYHSTVQ